LGQGLGSELDKGSDSWAQPNSGKCIWDFVGGEKFMVGKLQYEKWIREKFINENMVRAS